MKLKLSEPGVIVSGGVHILALLLLIVSFTKPQQFDPMQETVPIETISDTEFNQVMQGEKTASAVHPEALPKADKVDPSPEVKPTPPTPDAQKPPPPPPPTPEPVKQEPPSPPERPAPQPPVVADQTPTPPTPPTPPVRPAPTAPTPPERVDTDAEPIAQAKPVPTPPQPPRPPERVAEAKPLPPVKPHVAPKPPKPPKPDQLARLLDTDTPDQPAEKPTPRAPVRTRTAETDPDSRNFDPTDISRLLSHDAPAQRASTGREQSKLASLGSPTAHAEKMAPSLWGQLDGLMEEQYRQCWSYLGLNAGQKYVPQIRVMYDESGGLTADPVLVNPPSDPSLRSLAESAIRAVRRCNPLRIPPQYAPYYDEWKGRVLRFDPQEMAG